jgi:hypothetical protein
LRRRRKAAAALDDVRWAPIGAAASAMKERFGKFPVAVLKME